MRYPELRAPFQLERMLYDPRSRPLFIGVGPLPFFCFIWAVFAITLTRPIPLPDYLARAISIHPQSVTMIVAIVATVVASQISFFFSLAVRYVIAIRLVTKPTSLDTLTSVTHIAQKTLWLHNPLNKWTWIALLAYLSVILQTSSLTALFAVRSIRLSYPVNGRDLNMAELQLSQISNNIQFDPHNVLSLFSLQSIMMNSMRFGSNLPTTFNFNGYTYISTTGGIYPATYDEELTKKFNSIIPANLVDLSSGKHTQLPFNKTMNLVQQGFTADVDCRARDSQANTTYNPSISLLPFGTSGLSLVQLTANCPGGTLSSPGPIVYNTSDSINSGGILAVTCQLPNTSSIDIIIKATGAYETLDLTACTVSPKTTLVNVTYFTSPQNMDVPTTIHVSKPVSTADAPVWRKIVTDMLLFNINLGQSLQGNVMGNAWLLTGSNQGNITFSEAMNTFIRAGVEFTGTAIRQIWSQPSTSTALADPSFTPINGTFSTSAYGWHQDRVISPLFLLPTTITVLATYGLLIYGLVLARKYASVLVQGDAHFDPTDIVHIVAAHTPETRQKDFRFFSQGSTSYMRKTAVKLGSKGGVRAFQVSSNERAAARKGIFGSRDVPPLERHSEDFEPDK